VRAQTVNKASGIALLLTLAMTAGGCGRTQTADAQARDGAEKQVSTAVVVKDSVRRSLDVVGTLAAVDQVTISSEAEGTVRAILADLGDRVTTGQVLVRIDNEKQQYTYEQQQATLARALAQYGAPDPQHLPPIEQTPDVQKAKADLVQANQGYARADELFAKMLISQQQHDDARTALQSKQASYDSALQSARNLRASIQA
jgi:HlyD family secretion protein